MDLKRLGKKIKLARVERDWTQEELARKMGGLQKTISLYETGQAVPTLEALVKIAKVLKKPSAHFLDELA